MKEWIVIHQIKALHNKGNGLSERKIAKQLSISRNTVSKYLKMSETEVTEVLSDTDLLVEIKKTIDKTKITKNHLTKEQLRVFEKRYDTLITQGLEENPLVFAEVIEGKAKKRGKTKQTPARNLLVRLRDFKAGTLAFMYDFSVPFDNNLAERDIRMVKVKQKVSGGFRTQEGAKQFAAIRSYISTARKNSLSIFDAIPLCQNSCRL